MYAFAVPERLPLKWSDNTAMGKPPKWKAGGVMSYRMKDGKRRNWSEKVAAGAKIHTKNDADGKRRQAYLPPALSNPGNVIKCDVGGGRMGSDFAHENEAPFPEKLVEFFIRSYCPPGGVVFDPFSGSGTTAAVAKRCNRQWLGVDVRQSQVDLANRRLANVQRELIA